MMLGLSILLAALVLVIWRRRRFKRELSGRIAGKPTFTVEPPSRRVSRRKHEAL